MKKMMIALVAMLTIAATGKAMSYEQARNEALFLTDKMAYELNLTDEQYEAAYEINLDYLMGVTSYDDVYGNYWERRNLDLSYVLLDWQWQAFCAATYFYRPLYWRDGFWHFGIYARYPHRDYFYFGRPVFYASYRGGHAWHVVGGRGYYYGRRDHFRPVAGRSHFGMHDRWNRGDFHRDHGRVTHHRDINGGVRHRDFNGGMRNSSTRTTVNRHENMGRIGHDGSHSHQSGTFHNGSSHPTNGSFNNGSSRPSSSSFNNGSTSRHQGSFGSSHSTSHSSHSSGSFSGGITRSSSGGSFGGGHSGGHHSSGASQGGSHGSRGGAFSRGR